MSNVGQQLEQFGRRLDALERAMTGLLHVVRTHGEQTAAMTKVHQEHLQELRGLMDAMRRENDGDEPWRESLRPDGD